MRIKIIYSLWKEHYLRVNSRDTESNGAVRINGERYKLSPWH